MRSSFDGFSGSKLTGALPAIDGSGLTGWSWNSIKFRSNKSIEHFYYVNSVMSIGSTITVDPPPTALAVYTNYAECGGKIEDSADLIIESGDVVPDVLICLFHK